MTLQTAAISLLVVIASGAMDFLALRWQASASAGRVAQAVFWAVCVEVAGLTTVNYAVDGLVFAVAAIVGSALGTWISTGIARRGLSTSAHDMPRCVNDSSSD